MRRARMKEVLSAVLTAALLLCFVLSSCRMPGNDPNGGPSVIKGLSVTDCTLTIEEATGLVETGLLLHNDSGTACSGLYALPLISGGMKEGSLSVSASAGAVLTGGTDLSLSVPAHSDLSVSYRYTAAGSLVLSRAIGFDFSGLLPDPDASIGRFCVSVMLEETDLPLVKEVFPYNFTLSENTLSLELYDFKPTALLDRFYLMKETWRDLIGSHESEPGPAGLFLLEHARDWIRNGLPDTLLPERSSPDPKPGIQQLFSLLMNGSLTENAFEEYDTLLSDSEACHQLMIYLILKEAFRKGYRKTDFDNMHLLIPEHPLWPLVQEYFRQLYAPDTLHLITVGYFTEPSLQNASLYRFHSLDAYGEQFDYTLCDEASVLQALPTWIYSIDCLPENTLPYRAFVFSPGKIEDASSLQSFLDATGTPVFVRQQLLDNRDHRYDEYLTAENDPYEPAAFSHYLYSCADRDNIDADGLRNALKEYRENAEYSAERDSGRIFTGEDPLLSALSVPAFTHYAGRIETREDLDIVMMFYYHSYRSYEYGLAAYAAAAESPEGRRISNERDTRIAEKILKIREAIEAASSLPLTLLEEESTR